MPKGYSREYYQSHKEQLLEAKRRWAQNNKPRCAAYMRKWRQWNMWQSPEAERNRAFGAALRRWRKALGISQVRLGRYLGVSAVVISDCEIGAVPKRAAWFQAIPELYERLKEVERGFEHEPV